MARTVFGIVRRESNGQPVSSARVRAWDSDSTSGDDFMGENTTDSNGNYKINYHGGHWDPAPHWHTIWRPDIYITVEELVDNRWIRVFKSTVHEDQRHNTDLRLDAYIRDPNPMVRTIYGTVRLAGTNQPIEGAIVRAYDMDIGPDNDDKMGEATTDSQGNYKIQYRGGHWDTAPHWNPEWRPDISVRVRMKKNDGNWKRVWRSQTYTNHRHSEPLRVDPYIDPTKLDDDPPIPDNATFPKGTYYRVENCSKIWYEFEVRKATGDVVVSRARILPGMTSNSFFVPAGEQYNVQFWKLLPFGEWVESQSLTVTGATNKTDLNGHIPLGYCDTD
ncbi:MAG: hypothetical protein KC615_06175 [Anaerolineae bacterium]|nr:hypothetical protein [Anaerolineae bacterium]